MEKTLHIGTLLGGCNFRLRTYQRKRSGRCSGAHPLSELISGEMQKFLQSRVHLMR